MPSSGAQNEDARIIENKIEAANQFTESLDTPEEIAAYNGPDAEQAGRDYLDGINDDPETIPNEDDTDLAIQNLITPPDEAPAPGGGGGGGGGGGVPDPADVLLARWEALDEQYYDFVTREESGPGQNVGINNAFIKLANDYVDYLNDGNPAITDVIQQKVKDGDTYVDDNSRHQTFHDNVLGNISDSAYNSGRPHGDLRSDAADVFASRPLSNGNDADLGADGYQPNADFYKAAAWDYDHGISRPDYTSVAYGEEVAVDDIAQDDGVELFVGDGNTVDHFSVARHEGAGIELALKAKERGGPDELVGALDADSGVVNYDDVTVEGGAVPTYNFYGFDFARTQGADLSDLRDELGSDAEPLAWWSFDFSIATGLNGSERTISDFDIKLKLDIDPTASTAYLTLALDEDGQFVVDVLPDGLDFFLSPDDVYIGDNAFDDSEFDGDTLVVQNSHNYGFVNSLERLVNEFLGNGDQYGALSYNSGDNSLTNGGHDGKKPNFDFWEAETHQGNFSIVLEAWENGSMILDNEILVGTSGLDYFAAE